MADEENVPMVEEKPWWQSVTIRNSLVGLLVSVVTLVTAFTGKTWDIEWIKQAIEQGWALLPTAILAWTSFRSIIGRKKAEVLIK